MFDFEADGIAAKEDSLRLAAAELKEALQGPAGGVSDLAGYELLQAALSERLPDLYAKYDAYVAAVLATGNERVTCAKGCSHCCSHYVTSVEPYELVHLHARIRGGDAYPSRVVALHRRASLFRTLHDGSEGDDAEDRALHRYYLRNLACPFLEAGGTCGVYESRPMSCRMFHSLSHPKLCKGKGVVDPANRNFLIELPEDIEAHLARAGSAFAGFALPESLFEGLVKANELFGRFDSGGAEKAEEDGAIS
ncbi:MAG: YkgJ family cysteine cluster protein [Fibrobacteria bacterium]